MPKADETRVYCDRCPIVRYCWDDEDPQEGQTGENCVLAKLHQGEMRVHIRETCYVTDSPASGD
jgi:hypothetical protein